MKSSITSDTRAHMASMRANGINDDFAVIFYEHSTFKSYFGWDAEILGKDVSNLTDNDGEVKTWKDINVEMLNATLTKTMALYMQKCHIVLSLNPDDEDQSGMVWQIPHR